MEGGVMKKLMWLLYIVFIWVNGQIIRESILENWYMWEQWYGEWYRWAFLWRYVMHLLIVAILIKRSR